MADHSEGPAVRLAQAEGLARKLCASRGSQALVALASPGRTRCRPVCGHPMAEPMPTPA